MQQFSLSKPIQKQINQENEEKKQDELNIKINESKVPMDIDNEPMIKNMIGNFSIYFRK
jgi:hypothetical protein